MTTPEVIANLGHTADSRRRAFGPDDSSVVICEKMQASVQKLYDAAVETLRENAHLADGDNCTLIKLKRAVNLRD